MGRKRVKSKKFIVLQAALLLIAGLFFAALRPGGFGGGLTLYAFDVGQGDSFLFHFPGGENVLIDAGTRRSADGLVAKLRALGVRKIDILVASHPHEDHIGGMVSVMDAFDVGKIWDSGYNHGSSVQRAMLERAREKGIRFGRPRAGFAERIGSARIEVIAPDAPISGTASDANNNSLVLRVVYGDVAFLMTGDIEGEGRSLVGRFPAASVLKVSHHGSRNGTDSRLLREVSPDIAILSYGRGNSYGHPHREVLSLFRKFGVKAYSTEKGDIKIVTDGARYTVETGGAGK
jgi:competence protein ComEC